MTDRLFVPNVNTLEVDGLTFVPRVTIGHDVGKLTFNDNELTPDQTKHIIMLGAIRQRVMWSRESSGGGVMQCHSRNFEHGEPTNHFPWDESNFDEGVKDRPDLKLPCGSCSFANWTKDLSMPRGSSPAKCTEQVIVPMLIPVHYDITYDYSESVVELDYKVGAMSFQKSSIKQIADHMRAFRMKGVPAYSRLTRMTLNMNLGSGFKYSVPSLTAHDSVDEESYPLLSTILREVKQIVTAPTPKKAETTGGFLSVGPAVESKTGYTGTFFS